MTKADFVASVCDILNNEGFPLRSKAEGDRVVKAVFEALVQVAETNDSVVIPSIGTFSLGERKERMGRNIQTGEPMKVEGSYYLKFKNSSKLKERLNTKK